MFRDREFNLAFLASLAWHLFLVCCVTIVIMPANIKVARPSSVSFLGPILEKTAFEIMLGQKTGSNKPAYTQSVHFNRAFLPNNENEFNRLNKTRFEGRSAAPEKRRDNVNNKDLFGDFKFTPQLRTAEQGMAKRGEWFRPPLFASSKNLFIEGPLAAREVLFMPEAPAISRRVKREQEVFMVKLRVSVIASGNVDEIGLLISSGDPSVDLVAINYIKRFRFAPLSPAAKAAQEWGIIKIKLKSG